MTPRVAQRLSPPHPFVAAILLAAVPAFAENVDPGADGSRYAWAENVGWLNAEPLGNGGPGVQVDDFELTGWMWGENVGWISLSCRNTASCAVREWGVRNDGQGRLSGLAWSENVGWINFAPATGAVSIDMEAGWFAGHAWGENVGWITMSSAGPTAFGIRTSWTCTPPPPAPPGSPELFVAREGADAVMSWTAIPGATGYDAVEGDLGALGSSGGDFAIATTGCLANNLTLTTLRAPDLPPPGGGHWLLVRGVNCGGPGSYDSGAPSQSGSRDAEIGASGNGCP